MAILTLSSLQVAKTCSDIGKFISDNGKSMVTILSNVNDPCYQTLVKNHWLPTKHMTYIEARQTMPLGQDDWLVFMVDRFDLIQETIELFQFAKPEKCIMVLENIDFIALYDGLHCMVLMPISIASLHCKTPLIGTGHFQYKMEIKLCSKEWNFKET